VDATFFPDGNGVASAILRNSKGEAVAGSVKPMVNLVDATYAEALGLKYGLQLLDNMIGCIPVTVESDNMEVIQACTGEIELWSPFTPILLDCFQIASRTSALSERVK
jgi:ribonuclease HI